MALSRPRRSNAGSKMASLLNSMEADDFYTTTYGGFVEDDVDDDFVCEAVPGTGAVAADVDDDIVDSDFSIDENDEPRSDVENSDDPDRPKKLKRGQGVQTKAYKEPKRDQVRTFASFRFKIDLDFDFEIIFCLFQISFRQNLNELLQPLPSLHHPFRR